jgi:hypothetical protein
VIDIINNDYLKIAFKNNKKISLFHRKFRGIVRKN